MSYFPKNEVMTIVPENQFNESFDSFCIFPQENVSAHVYLTTTFFDT